MSDKGNFKGETGTNFMSQMKKFKDQGASEEPAKIPGVATQAAPTQQDPSNPVPPGPEHSPQAPATTVAEPKPATGEPEPLKFKGVVNTPQNQPLPTKIDAKEPEPAKEEPVAAEPKKPVAEKPKETKEPAAPQATKEPEPQSINDELVSNYLKEKYGKEVESLESLFKEPTDPFEGIDPDTKDFLKFNKDTGRPYSEFMELKKDWTALDPVQVARQQAIEKSGGVLNASNVDEYLEGKLGIDDLSDLTTNNKAELNIYNADYVAKKTADKEKYTTPTEGHTQKANTANQEMVTLETGAVMPKAQYDKLVEAQKQYIEDLRKTADQITSSKFNVSFDNNGEKIEKQVEYGYNKDEKHQMVESSADVLKAFQKLFVSDKGEDLAGVQEAMFWVHPQNREKVLNVFYNRGRADFAEEIAKQKSNPNYEQNRMPGTTGANTKATVENPFVKGQPRSGIAFAKELFKRN